MLRNSHDVERDEREVPSSQLKGPAWAVVGDLRDEPSAGTISPAAMNLAPVIAISV